MSRRTTKKRPEFELLNLNAAGLDIGAEEIYACVPVDRDPSPIRSFGTYTVDLHSLADWLESCGIEMVAMESTGIYWIPVFEILEMRGFESLWSTHAISRMYLVARATSLTVNGCSNCIPTVSCAVPFVRTKRYAPCERLFDIVGD